MVAHGAVERTPAQIVQAQPAVGRGRGSGCANEPDERAAVRQPLRPVHRFAVRARHVAAERRHRVNANAVDLSRGGGNRRCCAAQGPRHGIRYPRRGDVWRQHHSRHTAWQRCGRVCILADTPAPDVRDPVPARDVVRAQPRDRTLTPSLQCLIRLAGGYSVWKLTAIANSSSA